MSNILFHLRNKVKVRSGNEISLGKNTRIRQCKIFIKGKDNQLIIEDGANLKGVHIEVDGNGCVLSIGKNCVIGEGCYFSARESQTTLRIESDCMLSRNVKIMTSDGHDIYAESKRINPAKNITIGQHVWLADGAVVLKGCDIGEGSIVGINSVVTKAVPAFSIAAGNPAKIVKNNIQWDEKLTY